MEATEKTKYEIGSGKCFDCGRAIKPNHLRCAPCYKAFISWDCGQVPASVPRTAMHGWPQEPQ